MTRWNRAATAALLASTAWMSATAAQTSQAPARSARRPPPAARPADLVLRGGKIVTVDQARPEAQAIAITGDTIVALGSNQEIQPYVGPSTRVIDLKGALA